MAEQIGLELAGLIRRQPFEIVEAGRGRVRHVMAERLDLFGTARDHQLAEPLVRHAMLGAIGVEQARCAGEEVLLQRAFLVVEAGMDHLAVARGGVLADARLRFEHQHLATCRRQRAPHRKAHHPCADNDAVRCLHRMLPLVIYAGAVKSLVDG